MCRPLAGLDISHIIDYLVMRTGVRACREPIHLMLMSHDFGLLPHLILLSRYDTGSASCHVT